jgi:hypothetical protein
MKLKFYINSEGKKIYTLDEEIKSKKTSDAHYKFIRISDAPPSDVNIVRKN